MGYTHYWRVYDKIDTDRYNRALQDMRVLLEAREEKGHLDLTSVGSKIVFNGVDEDSHETFVAGAQPNEVGSFDFCKTARKPYDLEVKACVLLLHEAGYRISSDGEPKDFLDAQALLKEILGRDVSAPSKFDF